MSDKRSAFFVSDRTGITAEMLGHSLLTQFDQVAFSETTLPFIDTPQKAEQAVTEINQAGARDGTRPIVISTLVDVEVRAALANAQALVRPAVEGASAAAARRRARPRNKPLSRELR